MSALEILLISDGKPGHFRLSEGIIAAIARRRPVTVTRRDVARGWWLPGRALEALTNTAGGPSRMATAALGFDLAGVPRCDLVVSAGGDTLAANIAVARAQGCPNIFYGSLRRYRPQDFALVLTSYDANAGRANHAWALKPSAYDPDRLATPTADAATTVGLLLGGDSGTVRFCEADWGGIERLVAVGSTDVSRWIVSNSRRTPGEISARFAALASAEPGRIRFIDWARPESGTLGDLFAGSARIAVTVDSSSMVSEAVWARRPTVALMPARGALPALEQAYRDGLARERLVATLAIAETTPQRLGAAFAACRPLAINPLDNLAALIAARVPLLFAA